VKLTCTNRPFGLIIKLSQTVASFIGSGSFAVQFLPNPIQLSEAKALEKSDALPRRSSPPFAS
jgi:hypothetical protein